MFLCVQGSIGHMSDDTRHERWVFFLVKVFTSKRIFHSTKARSPLCSIRLSSRACLYSDARKLPLTHPPNRASAITNNRLSVSRPLLYTLLFKRVSYVYIVSDVRCANHLHDSELYAYYLYSVGVFPLAAHYLPFPGTVST